MDFHEVWFHRMCMKFYIEKISEIRFFVFHIHMLNLASCSTWGEKQTPTATYKTQLARLNICSDWGKPLIKQKFDRNLQKRNLQGRNLRGLSVRDFLCNAQKVLCNNRQAYFLEFFTL